MTAMRRLNGGLARAAGLLLTAALSLLAPGAPVSGGNWHTGDRLHCADCHVMHASRRGLAYGGAPSSPAGYQKLLRASTASELCLMCHEGGSGAADSPPDVMGPASYETPSLERAGGAFQAAVGVATPNGHDLAVAGEAAPGGTWSAGSAGLSCVDCHNPHGNAHYRNLVPVPGNASSDRLVTAISETSLSPTSARYSVANIRYTSSAQGLAVWCQGCHTNFHGQPGDTNLGGAVGGDIPGSSSYWFRHPTMGVTIAQGVTNKRLDSNYWFTGALSRVPVVSPSGLIPGSSGGSDNEVFCGSCHKAHGSPHRAALIWDDPTTAALEDGASATQTCQTCHYR